MDKFPGLWLILFSLTVYRTMHRHPKNQNGFHFKREESSQPVRYLAESNSMRFCVCSEARARPRVCMLYGHVYIFVFLAGRVSGDFLNVTYPSTNMCVERTLERIRIVDACFVCDLCREKDQTAQVYGTLH